MNRELAEAIAAAIFKVGSTPSDPIQRIALKGGHYPEAETDRGGLCEASLAQIIWNELVRLDVRVVKVLRTDEMAG